MDSEDDSLNKEQSITVAGWREITNSSLPCVGFQQEVQGFTPFTGRRRPPVSLPPPLIGGGSTIEQQRQLQHQHQHMQERQNNFCPLPPQQEHNFQRPLFCLLSQDFESVTSRLQSFLQRSQKYETARPSRCSTHDDNKRKESPPPYQEDNNCEADASSISDLPPHTHDSSHLDKMAYFGNSINNSPPISPSLLPSPSSLSSSSIFSISPHDAAAMVRLQRKDDDDCRSCYLIQLKLRPLFSDDIIPGAFLRKIPRLVNGIPLGAGFLSRDQLSGIKWRLIEGGHSTLTFISCPIDREEAEEHKNCLKDRLVKQAQKVFGDMIVKVNILLNKCIDYEDDFVINDIAVNLEEGLHFRD